MNTAAVAGQTGRRWNPEIARRPVVASTAALVLLYLVTGTQDTSLFGLDGVRSTLLLACPLAILAASQTLCMLTGGIDLSTVMVANLAAYVAASQSGQGPLVALGLAALVGIGVGAVNGIGVGIFKVNPLIMTLGTASILLGVITVGLTGTGFLAGSTRLLPAVSEIGGGTLFGPFPTNVLVLVVVGGAVIFGLSRTGASRSERSSCRQAMMAHELLVTGWHRQPSDYQEFTHAPPRRVHHPCGSDQLRPDSSSRRLLRGSVEDKGLSEKVDIGRAGRVRVVDGVGGAAHVGAPVIAPCGFPECRARPPLGLLAGGGPGTGASEHDSPRAERLGRCC